LNARCNPRQAPTPRFLIISVADHPLRENPPIDQPIEAARVRAKPAETARSDESSTTQKR
jgi:hypothetical protein